MRYQAVIFDLDGTLIDSLTDLAEAGNRVLAEMKMDVHPLAAYRIFVGDGLETLIQRILPKESRTESTIAEAIQRFRIDYGNNWHINTTLYPGIPDLLNQLTDAGLSMSILSNKPHVFTGLCVEHFLSNWHFEQILGHRPEVPKKPDGSGAVEIAKTLQLSPSQILFIGDSAVDMQTAANAGMDGAGVLWGFRGADELRQNGATYLASTPSELGQILL